MSECIRCGKKLSKDDIGLHKKLVNRGDEKFMCKSCLASHFEITEEQCDELIEKFRKNGCTLFK